MGAQPPESPTNSNLHQVAVEQQRWDFPLTYLTPSHHTPLRPSSPLALLNGSPLGQRPTGIGVVTLALAKALCPDRVMFLDPVATGHPNSLAIPNTLSSDFGRQGHLRRLLWTQHQLPCLLKQTGASFLLSPLPEAPLCGGGAPSCWPTI